MADHFVNDVCISYTIVRFRLFLAISFPYVDFLAEFLLYNGDEKLNFNPALHTSTLRGNTSRLKERHKPPSQKSVINNKVTSEKIC